MNAYTTFGVTALFLLVFYIWDSISLAFGVRDASLTFTMIIFKANYDVREEHISHGLLCISRPGSLSCRALGRTQHVGPWSISFFSCGDTRKHNIYSEK
jgi:hypothetical protein